MNQKKHDKLVREVEELEAANEKNQKEMEDIAEELGGYQQKVRNLSKKSDELTDLILTRDSRIEFKKKRIENFTAKNKD